VGGRHADERPDPDGATRFEAVVLDSPRGEGRTPLTAGPLFLSTLALTAVIAVVLGLDVRDNRALATNGTTATVRIVRTNDDQRGPTLTVEYFTGPVGRRVLVSRFVGRPQVGQTLTVLHHPDHPDRIIDAAVPVWDWGGYAMLGAFTAAGGVVTVAEGMRWRRRLHRRWRSR